MTLLIYYLSGAVTLGFFAASLFFLRFWRRTRDTLFLAFSLAFGLLGLAQSLIAVTNVYFEDRSFAYLIRLAAFAVIIVAIGRKNRKTS
ncbi:DUF5985 family protein [Frateuria hangzhouensis]|uniref:DUF5985 family protein n=1 Tax=Frateuria hangzhouensis TaxID=2995589 RepID=UPI002260DC41|nr:DUF5985 family protein [Frateuria sp. STR12]MCX7515224.1 DUF5985 family protein [Frateuria sp. STR12]